MKRSIGAAALLVALAFALGAAGCAGGTAGASGNNTSDPAMKGSY